MNDKNFLNGYFQGLTTALKTLNIADWYQMVEMIEKTHIAKKKVIIAGNGGSAAIASHLSVDLTKSLGIRAVCFNEAGLITCFANDFGYQDWLEKAIDYYADEGDLVVLISSSGESKNMINAARKCRASALRLITFSGFSADNSLRKTGDLNFWVDSDFYNVVETTHQTWLLATVDYLMT